MKMKWLCFLTISIGILFPYNLPASGEELKIATHLEGHWLSTKTAPFIRCAMEMINHPYSMNNVPWARAQKGTREGVYDSFFSATQNAQRDAYAVFSPSLFPIQWFYVIKKDSGIFPDDSNFNSKRFSANLGSSRLRWLKDKHSKKELVKEIVEVHISDQAMKMLAANRIDVVLMNGHGLEKSLARLSMDRNDFAIFLVRELVTGIYFSKEFLKRKPGFLEKFNAAFLQCNNSLESEKIR